MTFVPYGFKDGDIKLAVISYFLFCERTFVTCEYGFMIGTFDFLTGGKVCDFNVTKCRPMTNKEYADCSFKQAAATLNYNVNWVAVLNALPIINHI